MEFEWDVDKAASNAAKHGIEFDDAIAIFGGRVLELRSDHHGEERYRVIGELNGREIVVIYTPRGGRFRIISARKAARYERRAYREAYPAE